MDGREVGWLRWSTVVLFFSTLGLGRVRGVREFGRQSWPWPCVCARVCERGEMRGIKREMDAY